MRLLVVFNLILVAVFGNAYDKTEQNVYAQKIAGNSYYIEGLSGAATEYEGFISNAGFVVTNAGVVVFDALGTPALADAMILAIQKITNKPIKLVINSHYHADHIYGLSAFKKLGAQIWAPKGALDYFYSEAAKNLLAARQELLFPQMDENVHLIKPDRIIDKNTHFHLGGTDFMIYYLGAIHSEGDMMLSVKKDKVLFSGDLVFSGRVPFIGSGDVTNWLAALKLLAQLSPKYLIPGHGKATDDIKTSTQITQKYLQFMLDKFNQFVADLVPFDEAYRQIDWSDFKDLPAFDAANRRNALAVYLYLEQIL